MTRSSLFALLLALWATPLTAALAATPPTPATAVIVERVSSQRLADSLEALGTLRANETVQVRASVSEIISRINFEDGQQVNAGDVLVELADAEQAALLEEAMSLAEEAQRQYERIERLVQQSTASESLLDERRREWRTAQARVSAVRSRLSNHTIKAPFSGRVGLRQVSPGALVSPGDIITTLVDDSRMKLDFTVPSLYLATVRSGTPIDASTPVFPNRSFAGEVASVDSTIDPVTRSITVRAIIPNEQQDLVPGMLMTLNLLRNERQAVVVAEEAIVPRGGDTFVLVVNTTTEPYVAEQRLVQLGTRVPGLVEVVSGLSPGEIIVTHGALKLRPGAPVRILAENDGSRPVAELIKGGDARALKASDGGRG
ncbi:MAG: efflux RND transporter periplasmic adaptor subunit [Pseudomonadales bacterium]